MAPASSLHPATGAGWPATHTLRVHGSGTVTQFRSPPGQGPAAVSVCMLTAFTLPKPPIASGPRPPGPLPPSSRHVYRGPAVCPVPQSRPRAGSRTSALGETDAQKGGYTQEGTWGRAEAQPRGAPGPACGGEGHREPEGLGCVAGAEAKRGTGSGGMGSGDSSVQSGSKEQRGRRRGGGAKMLESLEGFHGKKPRLCVGLRRVCCESCTL